MYVHFKVTVSIFILVPKYELTTLFDSNTSSCPSIDRSFASFYRGRTIDGGRGRIGELVVANVQLYNGHEK